MKNRIRPGIKGKLILSIMGVITSIILILGIVVYQNFSKILLDNAIKDNQKRLEEITEQLDSIESQMAYIADYIITDNAVAEYTHAGYDETHAQINEDIYNMKSILTRFVVINQYLTGISLLRDDGVAFTNSADLDREYVHNYVMGLLKDKEAKKLDNRRFTNYHKIYANNIKKSMNVITYIARYTNIAYPGEVNYLFLDVPYDAIIKIMEQGESEFDKVILLNKENTVYYGDTDLPEGIYQKLSKDETSQMIEEGENIYILNIGENSNWKTIVSISKSKLFAAITPVMYAFVIAFIVCFLVLTLILITILSGIIKPLKNLAQGMRQVSKGDYNVRIHVNSKDEIEELAEGFNHMTSKIEQSIADSIQHEKTKRKLQLDLLMNQINPHFIYNTLNTVIYMAHDQKTQAVEDVTYSLINVLKDSVKIGKESICDYIHVELEIIKNYMKIQQYRYPDSFLFRVEYDEELSNLLIPKMVIQPLVENALFHGVCLCEHACEICVTIKKVITREETEQIEICVWDNGVGMDEDTLNQCLQAKGNLKDNNQTRSIGLSNIIERLNFIYGKSQSIQIYSKLDEGTKVTITVPVKASF